MFSLHTQAIMFEMYLLSALLYCTSPLLMQSHLIYSCSHVPGMNNALKMKDVCLLFL